MLVITALTDLTSTDQTVIGLPRSLSYSFQTNKAIAFINDLVFYFLPAQWINGSQLNETASTPPTKSYWEHLPTGATPLAVFVPCSFIASTNNENNLNYKASVRYDNVAGFVKVTFLLYSFNFSDQLNYFVGNPVDNKTKLTKDTFSNPNIFDNSQNDAYTASRFYRIATWIREPSLTTAAVTFFRFQRAEFPHFVMGADVRYVPKWDNDFFTLTFCGQASTTLSTIAASVVLFQVEHLTAEPVFAWYWQIYRTDQNNSAVNAVVNYQLSSLKDDLTTPSWQPTHDTLTNLLIAPNFAFVGANPGVWQGSVSIDNTALVNGGKYRIYVLAKTFNGLTFDWWSFSSPEYTAGDCQCFVKPSMNIISGISDYLHFLGLAALTSPQERLLSTVKLDFTPYNASRPFLALPNALSFINIRFYWISLTNPNIYHVTDEIALVKDVFNNWAPVSNNSFALPDPIVTIVGQEITINTEFRNHYETTPNIYDFNVINQSNLLATQTMDWTNHDIIVEYRFVIDFGNYTDTIVARHRNRVHDYDQFRSNEMSFVVTNQLNVPITEDQICSTNTLLNICSTTTDVNPTDAYFISGLDKALYQVSNFIEHESFPGLLTQLQNAFIISQEANYATFNDACAQLDLVMLLADSGLTDYRYVAIKKHFTLPAAPPCCGDPESADLFDVDYLDLIARMVAAGAPMPVLSRQKLIANTIEQLKLNNLWNKFDCIWFIGAHDRIAGRINWKGTGSTAFDLVEVNWAANHFVIDVGFQVTVPAGPALEYYETNFILNNGVAFQQNSASIWRVGEVAGNHIGIIDTLRSTQTFLVKDSTTYAVLNSIFPYTPTFPPPQLGSPFEGASRCNAVEYQQYSTAAGAAISLGGLTQPFASAARAQFSSHIRSVSTNGVSGIGGNPGDVHTNSFAAFGGCLTLDETKAFYQIIRCYFLAINFAYFNPKLPVQ